MKYLIIYERTSTGYSAYAPDLPGCIAAGSSFAETAELMRGAVEMHLEAMRADGDTMPESTTLADSLEAPAGSGENTTRMPKKPLQFEWPSQDGVEAFREIAEEFMRKIFELEPSDYLITDESRLSDFREITDDELQEAIRRKRAKQPRPTARPWDPEPLRDKIRAHYGPEIAALESGNLLEIFRRIKAERSDHRRSAQ